MDPLTPIHLNEKKTTCRGSSGPCIGGILCEWSATRKLCLRPLSAAAVTWTDSQKTSPLRAIGWGYPLTIWTPLRYAVSGSP